MVIMIAKVIVVYESKYGNTKRVAETIIEGMNEIGGIEASLGLQVACLTRKAGRT